MSNLEIRHDVTSGRLHTSLQVTIKRAYFSEIPYTTHAFYGYSFEVHILPEYITSISMLDRVYTSRGVYRQDSQKSSVMTTSYITRVFVLFCFVFSFFFLMISLLFGGQMEEKRVKIL